MNDDQVKESDTAELVEVKTLHLLRTDQEQTEEEAQYAAKLQAEEEAQYAAKLQAEEEAQYAAKLQAEESAQPEETDSSLKSE